MIDVKLLLQLYPTPNDFMNLTTDLQESPSLVTPIVTQSDAANGYITRYFVRQTNDVGLVIEVDKLQFDKFKSNPRFIVAKIRWKIVGKKDSTMTSYGATSRGVRDININEVSKADLTFGGLMRYIQDYTEFWVSER